MAKKKISKKTKNKLKKAYKKASTGTKISFILLVLVLAVLVFFLYTKGYLDFILKPETKPSFTTGDHEQNEDGFYYYKDNGLNEGEYYASIKDMTGEALEKELASIIRVYHKVSYGDARYVLAYSDRNPKDDFNSVLGIYDNDKIADYWIGTGEGKWQREHVWPNSKLGVVGVENHHRNQASDLHNLRAITGINQSRSNRYFDLSSGDAKIVGTSGFYPGDDHKGDVARILLYMSVMYDFLTLTDDISLLSNNVDTNNTLAGAYSGKLSLLLQWHKEDAVDAFEVRRNEIIYSEVIKDPNGKDITPQGNRNPFIDKPELVHLIWEGLSIEDLTKTETEEIETMLFLEFSFDKTFDIYYLPNRKRDLFI